MEICDFRITCKLMVDKTVRKVQLSIIFNLENCQELNFWVFVIIFKLIQTGLSILIDTGFQY